MKVRIPTPLLSYTDQQSTVDAHGESLGGLLADLEASYRGIRFRMVDEHDRIRQHMKVFVNGESVRDLATALSATDEVTIMQALSGG